MLRIRTIRRSDLAAFSALLASASPDIDLSAAQALIDDSQQALAGDGPVPQRLVFVLDDSTDPPGRQPGQPPGHPLLGAITLAGSIGLDLPRASYRIGTVVHASAELKMFHRAHTLLLCNDLTGCAEIGVPVMAPTDAAQSLLRLLVDAALLFVADHPDRFAATLIAELPGIGGPHGASPFWRGLGRHFHPGPLPKDSAFFPAPARSHMARLMPKHPLYSALLGPDAEACIGQHTAAAQALADALQAQGLRHHGQVNLFDAGPVLEASVADVVAVRDAQRCRIVIKADPSVTTAQTKAAMPLLLATADETAVDGWQAVPITASMHNGLLFTAEEDARVLGLADGQRVRVLPQGHAQPPATP